ncbi:MAG: ABC transporter permease [Fuerstiella sp.]|nr:ABC transporter permease [Fuerstiella sp.]
MSFPRLFNQFVLRALLREKTRTTIAALGVGLGVAVMIAIRLANVSVTETFRAAVDSVGGNTSLRIRGAAGRFDEQLFAALDPIRSYGHLSPVIEAYAMVGDGDFRSDTIDGFPRGELLHVLGVDVLLDFPLRDYEVLRVGATEKQSAREALRLLDGSRSIILTEKFLRRHELRVGDEVPLTFGSLTQAFTIRGVLLDRGPAQTLDGNFALMDIAAAQLASNRLGFLDHVDVLLRPEFSTEDILADIQLALPKGLVAELPDATSGRADTMIAAFQFNLSALSAVALIVGLFLIYNAVAMSVAARRAEIGMLQAVGAGRRMVLSLFLTEAVFMAVVGIAVGLPAGRLLGSAAVTATAQTVETFYIAAIAESSASSLHLTLTDILAVVCIVVPLALMAALVPAWEAATVQPVDAVRGSGKRLSPRALARAAMAGLLSLGLGWLLTFGKPIGGVPILGFLAEIALMLGGALLTPLALRLVCAGVRSVSHHLLPARRTEIRLAASNMEGELPRLSVSVAALGISLSMMVAIAVMVGSFRETVVYWLDSALSADLSIKPVMQTSAVSEARLSRRTFDVVANDTDVVDTIWFGARQLPYQNRNIRLATTELEKTLERARLIFKAPPIEKITDDSVVVSESFSLLFDSPAGTSIELPTSKGSSSFQIAGVYYDYASNQGTILMDAAVFRQHYGEKDPLLTAQTLAVYLRPEADIEQVRSRILGQLGPDEQIYCVTSREVRAEALKIFESTFAVTYALQFIAILVAGMGVASTLITLIYKRQKDIGLLSLIGATGKQVRRVIVIEAVLLGGVSQLVGIFIGILLAMVLIFVINVQSFGWTIQFLLPVQFIIQSTLLVLIASGLFGLYPAIRAAGVDALQTVREEHA